MLPSPAYNARRGEWQKDIESTGEALDGQCRLELPRSWQCWALGEFDPAKPKTNVREYECLFAPECEQNLSDLVLKTSDALLLVQGEFIRHTNYFLFDLEDYPLPVRGNYIVYLNRVKPAPRRN